MEGRGDGMSSRRISNGKKRRKMSNGRKSRRMSSRMGEEE